MDNWARNYRSQCSGSGWSSRPTSGQKSGDGGGMVMGGLCWGKYVGDLPSLSTIRFFSKMWNCLTVGAGLRPQSSGLPECGPKATLHWTIILYRVKSRKNLFKRQRGYVPASLHCHTSCTFFALSQKSTARIRELPFGQKSMKLNAVVLWIRARPSLANNFDRHKMKST